MKLVKFEIPLDGEVEICAINPRHVAFLRPGISGATLIWLVGDRRAVEVRMEFERVVRLLVSKR